MNNKLKTYLSKNFLFDNIALKVQIALGQLEEQDMFLYICSLYAAGYSTLDVSTYFGIPYEDQFRIVVKYTKQQASPEALAVRLRNLTEAEGAIKTLSKALQTKDYSVLKDYFPNLGNKNRQLLEQNNIKIVDVEFEDD